MQLNREQAQCVEEDGHCLVVACPGSGKTRVITRKIAALLSRHPDARIAAVTFTRDSAGELTERATHEIGEAKFKLSCRIGTFHSLAIRQLRGANLLGSLASPAQQYALMGRAISQSKFGGSWEEATQIIESAKTALTEHPSHDEPVYLAYEELLSRQKLVDLYDVLRNAVTYMRDGRIKPYPVQFMLVDEFQDTDHVQMAWVLEHAKVGTLTTCVADDDQSIYSWRGALGNVGMLDYKATCNARLITLGQNYRSHSEILAFADAIIRLDEARIPKALVAARGPGGKVSLHRAGTAINEAEQVADEIERHTVPLDIPTKAFTRTVPAGSWAVLSRGRRYLDGLETELQLRKIKYRRPASDSIWNRAPFLQMLMLLRSLQSGNPDGVDSALHHALSIQFGAPAANNAMDTLHRLAGDRFSHLIDGWIPPEAQRTLVAPEMEVVTTFATLSGFWRQRLADGLYSVVISGVAKWLAKFEKDEKAIQLIERMGVFLAEMNGSLVSRVNATSEKPNQKGNDGPKDGVVLTTMHASKGLEFDRVWVIGCNDNIIPSPKSGNLAEERRLLYVAVTRAKKVLHLSATTEAKVSPLLTEAGVTFNTTH